MNTFSIEAGDYEGFSFRVNPVDSSIVEFSYDCDACDGDTHDGRHTAIVQFKRNGGLVGVTRVPQHEDYVVTRDGVTGAPSVANAPFPVDEKGSPRAQDGYRADGNPLGAYGSVNDRDRDAQGRPLPGNPRDGKSRDPRIGNPNAGVVNTTRSMAESRNETQGQAQGQGSPAKAPAPYQT